MRLEPREPLHLLHVFQSTHPLRGATPAPDWCTLPKAFQSTHPLRGATKAGIDIYLGLDDFNPRTPCGVRPPLFAYINIHGRNFNPRTPCGVRPNGGGSSTMTREISIHAPLAGCDNVGCNVYQLRQDFNPRTPCGVRPAAEIMADEAVLFQSTHPLRGATILPPKAYGRFIFQSTHPLRGATMMASVFYTM